MLFIVIFVNNNSLAHFSFHKSLKYFGMVLHYFHVKPEVCQGFKFLFTHVTMKRISECFSLF